jgi:rubrerythrin
MNLHNIFDEIEKADPEFTERTSPRREVIRNMGSFGKKVALTALPLALGGLFKKAYGQTPSDVLDVLNFALTLEYLESEFYKKGVATSGLIPAGTPAFTALTRIRDDEAAHVAFLRTTIASLQGGTQPATKTFASFDYTAKNTFPDVFSNYDTFLAVAQAFEDTGVRAYKGQAPRLMGTANRAVLTAALQIHSVEARHASHLRQMRRARGAASGTLKPWITGTVSGIGSATNAIYAGEDNTMQAGVNISGITADGITISPNAATEAFDEFLTKDQVLAIVTPFLA